MKHADPRHLLVHIAKILEQLHIPYIVTGGIAVLVWGRPRFTADIDIVSGLKMSEVPKLEKVLKKLSDTGYVDRLAMEKALTEEGEFNFIDGESGVKIDFWILKKEKFDLSRIKRKVEKKILGQRVFFTSPEDLILIKLQWYKKSASSRQLEDVESILKISGKQLDTPYLKAWAKALKVESILNKLL